MFKVNLYGTGGKVKLLLRLTEHCETMTFVAAEVKFFLFFTHVLDGSYCSSSRHCNFTTAEKIPVSHWVRS
jgi:hypothetical protein